MSISPRLQRAKFGKVLKAINVKLWNAKAENQAGFVPANDILMLIANEIRSCQSAFKYRTSRYESPNRKRRQELNVLAIVDYVALLNTERASHHFSRMLIAVLYRYKQLTGGVGNIDAVYKNEFDVYLSQVSFEKVSYHAILESTVQDSIFTIEPSPRSNALQPFSFGMSECELVRQLDDIERIPSYPNKQADLLENFTYLLWQEVDMQSCMKYCAAAIAHQACHFMIALLSEYEKACYRIWCAEQTTNKVQRNLDELIGVPIKQKRDLLNQLCGDLIIEQRKLSQISLNSDRLFNRINQRIKETHEMLSSSMQDIRELYACIMDKAEGLRDLFRNIMRNYSGLYTLHDIECAERKILNHAEQDVDDVLRGMSWDKLSRLSAYFINQDIIDRINRITPPNQTALLERP